MHCNAEKERKEHFIIDCERDFRHSQVPKYLQHVFKPNKRYRKPKGQSRIDNPEKLATLVTQDTGGRQTKQKTQQRKLKKDEQRGPHQKSGVNPGARVE